MSHSLRPLVLEDQSRRVTALPAKLSVVPFSRMSDLSSRFRFSFFVQSPHFLKWEETNTMLITLECSATRQKGSRIVEQVDV